MSAWVLAAVVVVTCWRVAATHDVFSPTWDEPAHVFAGYEYLVDGRYTFDISHPPLARIVFAWPLRNANATGTDVHERVGNMFTSTGSYMSGVVAARRGNLLFLAAALCGLWVWTFDALGARAAAIAVILFALLPAILAHAGLATTDIPLTAAVAVSGAVFQRWLRTTDWRYTLLLAGAVGAGLLTKFSFPMYFAIVAVVMVVAARRVPLKHAFAAAAGGMAIVWAVYFFNRLPRFFRGFAVVMRHNAEGHDAYFLGELQSHGWWEYFPVVLGVKTPIAFLLLALLGGFLALREQKNRRLMVMALLMLGLAMSSRINLGVRHILPIYIPLSMLAATAILHLWRRRTWPAAAALVAWLCVSSVAAHPDYLPWMNALAGRHPERVVLDSNFDWGQDVVRLRDTCRALRIPQLGAALFGSTDLVRIGMPPVTLVPREQGGRGWYAVSESFIIPEQVRDANAFRWLTEGRPFRRVGKTIRLYRVD